MSKFSNPPKIEEVDFSTETSKEEMPTIHCKGKCNHEMVGRGDNGGPVIKCRACKRTFGDI